MFYKYGQKNCQLKLKIIKAAIFGAGLRLLGRQNLYWLLSKSKLAIKFFVWLLIWVYKDKMFTNNFDFFLFHIGKSKH